MKALLFSLVGMVAVVAITTITTKQGEVNDLAAIGPMAPSGPTRVGRQYRVSCESQTDGGSPVELLVPMDGGTAGKPIEADDIYVAPIKSSTVNVRVGFGKTGADKLTSSTGFEVGNTSARDGTGVSLNATSSAVPTCISDGARQQVDVIMGRQ